MQHNLANHGNPKNCSNPAQKHVDHILKKYPELLIALNCVKVNKHVPNQRIKRLRKLPNWLRIKQFENAFFEALNYDKTLVLLHCPLCRKLLKGPVTVNCGHTFCSDCLNIVDKETKCVICSTDITNVGSINRLVQELVEKWRERNKNDDSKNCTVPNTADILGIEPRYHLRSGYTGLHIKDDNKINVDYVESRNSLKIVVDAQDCNIITHNKKPIDIFLSNEQFRVALNNIFKEVDTIKVTALKSKWNNIGITDLECILCCRCILDPVTTACGHTFCRFCLTRVLDHGLACPLCMKSLNISDYFRGTTLVLDEAVKFLVPDDYNERMLMHFKENSIDDGSDIPVFVCTSAFPGVACPLKVYEPRYRLLVRRCLMSPKKRFAMVAKSSVSEKFVGYGTVLEIKDAVHFEDGSFILTTVGLRRFKVGSRSEQDGYDTAKIQYIEDNMIRKAKFREISILQKEVYKKALNWVLTLAPKTLNEIERLIGEMPEIEKDWYSLPDGPSWTWWLIPIFPLRTHLQVGFLRTVSLEKRLLAIDRLLDHMNFVMNAFQKDKLNSTISEYTRETCSDSYPYAISF